MGRCPSGQREQTVNLPALLRRFESFSAHQNFTDPLVTAGVLEHFLHDGDVQPAIELAADLALDPDLSESAGGV